MEAAAIEVNNLQKRYKDTIAVAGIDLTVKKGDIFGLVGADGAGKTTSIKMLCMLERPSAGTVAVMGLDTLKQAAYIKPRIGYMSERFSLYSTLTVEENLDFFARLRLVPRVQARERKKELLEFSRLEPFRNRLAEQLSGGMQKKLALCCCLIHKPEIVFMDEPTNGVDPVSRRDFWLIVSRFVAQGITVFVSTPYLDEAERFNRVALMHEGKIIACNSPEKLKSQLPGELIQIKTDLPEKALALLRKTAWITSAQIFGDAIHLLVDNAGKRLSEIPVLLKEEGLTLEDARPIAPGLEDVFINLLDGSKAPVAPLVLSTESAKAAQNKSADPQGKVIQVSSLTRKFGHFTAVDQVSFAVKRGEIFGFLGPNGSGKTTTIRMLCGLLKPTSGEADVLGQDMMTVSNTFRTKIGYMSQKFSLFPDLTVAENINFYGGLYSLSGPLLNERRNWVLQMAGLQGKEKLLSRDLSGGWKQRLALGCAIIHRPQVILLDEPTAGVDPLSRRFFWDLIQELAIQGTTILVSTHYMDEAEHCHRLGLMHRGKLIATGSPSQLKTEQIKGKLIEIKCSDLTKAVELLSTQPVYHQVGFFGSTIHLIVDEEQPDFQDIRTLLENQGVLIQNITPIPFTIEDVFVSLIETQENQAGSLKTKGV